MAEILHIDPEHIRGRLIARAAQVLRDGGVVAYPTDTVYGLGCDITVKAGLERIRRMKGTDAKKPMSFVCSDLNDISRYAKVSNFAYRILKRCLPGAYTFVLPATKETPRMAQSKQKTVGIRIPDHPVPLALVSELGNPIISTSANRTTEEVITDPVDLEREFGSQAGVILECGHLPEQPSTVISLVGDEVTILREGLGDIEMLLPETA